MHTDRGMMDCMMGDQGHVVIRGLGKVKFASDLARLSLTCRDLNLCVQASACSGVHRLFPNERTCVCGGEILTCPTNQTQDIYRHVCQECAGPRVAGCAVNKNPVHFSCFIQRLVHVALAGMVGHYVHFVVTPISTKSATSIELSFAFLGVTKEFKRVFDAPPFTLQGEPVPDDVQLNACVCARRIEINNPRAASSQRPPGSANWCIYDDISGYWLELVEADLTRRIITTKRLMY
jgi:hypothetical protein